MRPVADAGAPDVSGDPTLREALRRDYERLRGRVPSGPGWVRTAFDLRFLPVLLYRLGASWQSAGWRRLAAGWFALDRLLFGLEIARQAKIGPGLLLPHPVAVVLGAARIGPDATIFQGVTLGAKELDLGFDPARRPVLGAGVVVGAGAKVLGGVTVGDGATIGANSVVLEDVPSGVVVAGIPARPVGQGGGPTP